MELQEEWEGNFYEKEVDKANSGNTPKVFKTAEIDSTFYRIPQKARSWVG